MARATAPREMNILQGVDGVVDDRAVLQPFISLLPVPYHLGTCRAVSHEGFVNQ